MVSANSSFILAVIEVSHTGKVPTQTILLLSPISSVGFSDLVHSHRKHLNHENKERPLQEGFSSISNKNENFFSA